MPLSAPQRRPSLAPWWLLSSAVGRFLWFQPDGPKVCRHKVAPSVDAAAVNTFVELIGDDTQVSVLHDDVAGDGGQDLLAIFIPAGEEKPPPSPPPPPPPPSPPPAAADLTLVADRGLLLPHRNPTTFPRGTNLTLTLAGGGVGVATASRGSGEQETGVVAEAFGRADPPGLTQAEVAAPGTVLLHEGPSALTEAQASPGPTHPLLIPAPCRRNKAELAEAAAAAAPAAAAPSSHRRASGWPTRRPGRRSSGPCRWRWDASGPWAPRSATAPERGRSRGPPPGPGR